MSAEAVSPISTYFRVYDGVRARFADNRVESDITVLLLAPWPESLWAFRRIPRSRGAGATVSRSSSTSSAYTRSSSWRCRRQLPPLPPGACSLSTRTSPSSRAARTSVH
jgi:hypothetical protein